ncbi:MULTISPECIES: M23 family metallopeptidase [unclassified Microbacterium]|uniref:M23 family metallopeptidase n=1 Tax=unclassified Microbacterium TaxID=2609290 RepID=UPI003015C721
MPFENPQAASAPTRRSSRHRNAASEAPAAGATAPLTQGETALVIAAAAPLSRRAARERRAAEVIIESPDEPFIAATPEPIIADVPAVPDSAASDATAATGAEDLVEVDAPFVDAADAATTAPVASAQTSPRGIRVEDEADAFERASRAFRTTGIVPTVSADQHAPEAEPQDETVAPAHVAPRRPRSLRKAVTLGATVGVMGLAGLLAVGMTLPAEAVAAVQGTRAAATSLVSATAAEKNGTAADEIQAFVAPSDVENESLDRADSFSTISLVQVAEEQGINYSGEVFTNDPDAAIQWPFQVGVGMSYGYGMRSGRLHEGIDFVPGDGAPVQAIADGTVRTATEQGGAYGVTVYIEHVIDGQLITSHYAHMQYGSLRVKTGDKVTVGTVIGKTGNTGRSYGAHMHFEIIINGATIDPLPWLRENAGRMSY